MNSTSSFALGLLVGVLFVSVAVSGFFAWQQHTGSSAGAVSLLFNGAYILIALRLSFMLIYMLVSLFAIDSTHNTWSQFVLNFVLMTGMLAIVFRLVSTNSTLTHPPLLRVFINTLLYIPCLVYVGLQAMWGGVHVMGSNRIENPFLRLLWNGIMYIPCLLLYCIRETVQLLHNSHPQTNVSAMETRWLSLALALFVLYFLWLGLGKAYFKRLHWTMGGQGVFYAPKSTATLTSVTSYQSLSSEPTYRFALSCWIYLDAFAPHSGKRNVSLLSFGNNPGIQYNGHDNTLRIVVKPNDATLDEDATRLVYTRPHIELQKWNHVLLNMSGGTLDVFYNGVLAKSAINVSPYIRFDMLTVGDNNGISGNIAEVVFFAAPLSLPNIQRLAARTPHF